MILKKSLIIEAIIEHLFETHPGKWMGFEEIEDRTSFGLALEKVVQDLELDPSPSMEIEMAKP